MCAMLFKNSFISHSRKTQGRKWRWSAHTVASPLFKVVKPSVWSVVCFILEVFLPLLILFNKIEGYVWKRTLYNMTNIYRNIKETLPNKWMDRMQWSWWEPDCPEKRHQITGLSVTLEENEGKNAKVLMMSHTYFIHGYRQTWDVLSCPTTPTKATTMTLQNGTGTFELLDLWKQSINQTNKQNHTNPQTTKHLSGNSCYQVVTHYNRGKSVSWAQQN